ncbi:MAG: VOC family protein [Thermoanaerobaculia bacterium]
MTLKQAVPFFGITNMDRSLRFYTEGLGFTMKLRWIDDGKLRWCLLERDAVALMLQELTVPRTIGDAASICFICEDAIALYREFRSRGIDARRPFVGNGLWVTTVSDPDGYRLEFESVTDAPEDSVLEDDPPV